MSVYTFLKKDLTWSRHRIVAIVILFVIVPAIIGTGSLFFEHTVPENSPVAITPGTEHVTRNDLEVVRGGIAFVSEPTIVPDRGEAFDRLRREEVYAVVVVPPDLTSPGATATIDVRVHGSMTIFQLPSRALVELLSRTLDGTLPGDVEVTRTVVGDTKRLSEYMLPTFMMLTVMLVAFTYVPYNLASEGRVFDRFRLKSSLESLIAAKLCFFAALVTVSLLVIYGVGLALGYGLEPPSMVAMVTFLLSFLGLAALSIAIMLVTDFSDAGRVLNVVVLFLLVVTSNLAYPAGFFSALSRTVARHNPLHYAMIVARSHLLKDVPPGTFAGWIARIAAVVIGCLGVLELTILWYERHQ